MKSFVKILSFGLWFTLLALFSILLHSGCKKQDLVRKQGDHGPTGLMQTQIGVRPITISTDEIFTQLPQTIMYNLADKAKLYVGRAEWSYQKDYLMVRIPVTADSSSFIYAAKSYEYPDAGVHVYAVRFFEEPGSTPGSFTGRQMWINFQDWHVYGVRYDNGIPTNHLNPVKLADPDWETCAMEGEKLYLTPEYKIAVKDDESANALGSHFAARGPLDCPGNGGFWKGLGNFFGGIISAIGDFFSGIGNWFDGWGSGSGGGAGGGWGGGGPGGGFGGGGWPGGGWPGRGGPGGAWGGSGGGGGGSSTPPPVIVYEPVSGGTAWTCLNNNPEGTVPPMYIGNVSIQNEGQTSFHTDTRDENDFLNIRKTELELILQANPQALIDCDLIAQMELYAPMWQNVASFQLPTSVRSRLENLATLYPNIAADSRFQIQPLDFAAGRMVNCDFFPIHINPMPIINGHELTPLELLEHFRKNMDNFVDTRIAEFAPYVDNGLDDTPLWNQHQEDAIGALVSINMLNDGTVVLGNYNTNPSSYHFTFSTLVTPLDGFHPVSGNRRFGIAPDPNGGYIFYTLGVDRVSTPGFAVLGFLLGPRAGFPTPFEAADNLWRSLQSKMKQFVNNNGGSAVSYIPADITARIPWDLVRSYLLGQITWQTFKQNIGCP